MMSPRFSLEEVFAKVSDKDLLKIADKVINQQRLTEEEGVLLFQKAEFIK